MGEEQFAHLPTGIDLCHQTFGDPADPTVLLVMGLGGPMGWWRTAFCEKLARRGFHVVRYDNRDTGRSTSLRHRRVSMRDILGAYVRPGRAPYGIIDLAEDAIGLLDHLGVEKAHVVGVSMGGMIAQEIAIGWPDRVASLTSIMSTTGRRTAGWIHPAVIPTMLRPGGSTREEYIDGVVASAKVIGSPAFPTPEDKTRARAAETWDRGWLASGVRRHMLAVLTARDRTDLLRELDVPTTVIHGGSDRLVHRSGGRATAAAIRGAEHLEIAGMAHDLPEQLDDPILDAIVSTAKRATVSR